MNKEIYQEVRMEVENKESPFVVKQGENVYIIKGDLFDRVLEIFPPHLNKAKASDPHSSLYSVYFHTQTNGLVIVNKGASLYFM